VKWLPGQRIPQKGSAEPKVLSRHPFENLTPDTQMSRVVELAVLFAAGAITGGAFIYSTRKETPPPTPQSPSPPAVPTQLLRKDVALGEPMTEGCCLNV